MVYPRAAAVELWTTFDVLDGATLALQNLNAYDITVSAGRLEYISGLQTSREEGGSYTRRERWLADGEWAEFGSPTLASETTMPYFAVSDGLHRSPGSCGRERGRR